ncbi:uncharacterized protein BT62DRAFT_912395 [Guyanagaster necrorhizus]|uniref:Tafazzin family protein n=1 Tax=Guyanagaster necrorhizus TaxID=856835 RepID=A0A9P8ALH0_9AGAR|nr:uncharacterized protein BT62DRAFT_912395 [Guyanagaster necrorhizus MCA 3950]KAG7439790.1 hypothetical protein BT62DRAFT_912395 [Guyanagaster necrorhizus MCA 3950]
MSPITVTTIGLTCKAFLSSGLCAVTINGLPTLIEALNSAQREYGCGVVTVSNHISTLDDPVTWGVLPAKYYLRSRMTRWTLGASDIMFTNPILSYFFTHGQVLETFRGKGIFQRSVDAAIDKLNKGDWIHLYGEGKVNQPSMYQKDQDGLAILPRFKWGVGRIISSTTTIPTVIPMWITGFDTLMPEGRPFPYNFMPRIGACLSVTFGPPIPSEEIKRVIDHLRETSTADLDVKIRTEVTAIVHQAVQALGRSVSGVSLRGTTYA